MQSGNLKGQFKKGSRKVDVTLPVMFFEEEGVQIAYIPVLDLSGYGSDEQEAKKSLQTVLEEYIDYTLNKNTLIDDLKAHGWTIRKKTKPYIAPEITDLFEKNQYLHDIVNTKPYKMDRMNVALPQYADC